MQATCHPDRRHKAFGLCERCWRKTPEQRAKARERLQRWRAVNPGVNRKYQLTAAYGLTPADYDAMLDRQGGVCAICKVPPDGKHFAVDHNHETGAIRGILCIRCNVNLERVEQPGWLASALEYLQGSG